MARTLPPDLSALEPKSLEEARKERDERLTPLFRRWPALSQFELRELRRLYDERIRIAKQLGSLRRRRRAEARPSSG
jgi:hypothetical protein